MKIYFLVKLVTFIAPVTSEIRFEQFKFSLLQMFSTKFDAAPPLLIRKHYNYSDTLQKEIANFKDQGFFWYPFGLNSRIPNQYKSCHIKKKENIFINQIVFSRNFNSKTNHLLLSLTLAINVSAAIFVTSDEI